MEVSGITCSLSAVHVVSVLSLRSASILRNTGEMVQGSDPSMVFSLGLVHWKKLIGINRSDFQLAG